jgi:hypothetical protein
VSEFKTLSRCLASANPGTLTFFCHGCDMSHTINVGTPSGPQWGFNGSHEAPTFTPSVLVSWDQRGQKKVCHSFITDGRIHYPGDSTHALAGQTVPLADWDESWANW